MSIVGAYMVPHPPMIVPAVGRGSEEQVRETTAAYEQVAREIAAIDPETIVIISPHSVMYADYFHISPGKTSKGSFGEFGAPGVKFDEEYDTELVSEITRLAALRDFPAGTLGERDPKLDHGTMVPLWFIRQAEEYAHNSDSIATSGSSRDSNSIATVGPVRKSESSGSSFAGNSNSSPGSSFAGNSNSSSRKSRIVRIGLSGLPLTDHYRLGMIIQEAIRNTGRKVAIIASGDLSHKLQYYGPYGFADEGPKYDERIMDVMSRASFGELFDFDETFCDKAAECGHRSFVIMAGAFDGMHVKATRLSHQDITGVGYGICTFYPDHSDHPDYLNNSDSRVESCNDSADDASANIAGAGDINADASLHDASANFEKDASRCFLDMYLEKEAHELEKRRSSSDAYVRLARDTVESFILNGKKPVIHELPYDLPPEMLNEKAGAFVSIHKQGQLRGCIGTIAPTTACVAQEIIDNAVSASTRDPRFSPIRPDELKWLEINVDVLGEPEDIRSKDELDVRRYGVIVTAGRKKGLLLPDLEGVDTVDQQIDIARQKAGIRKFEKYRLQRFEVIRHK